jgi:hypothetical protein
LRARLEDTRVEPLTGLHLNGRLLVLPTNIRLGWKGMEVANAPVYYNAAAINAVKSFITMFVIS